jgi:multiple sugar transport system permease protein
MQVTDAVPDPRAPLPANVAVSRENHLVTRPKSRASAKGDRLAAWVFVAPNLIFYLLFIVIPALTGVVLSFYSWDLFTSPKFVGLANYRTLMHDPLVVTSLEHSLMFVVLGVVPTMMLGFVFAALLDWQIRTIGAIRLLYFLPLVVSTAVAGVLWSTLFSSSTGMVNRALDLVGIKGPEWLASTTWALPALTVVIIWISLPLVIILYLAGLQRVPQQIYEAARIDGAGVWVRLWGITWPNVRATTMLVIVLEILQFLALPLEIGLIMTHGGPLDATTSISFYAYRQAFELGNMGFASAISMAQFFALLAIVATVAATIRRLGRPRA